MRDQGSRDVHHYVAGLAFPASKLDVIATAEANGAPQPLIERLQALEHERIESVAALDKAAGG